jgi:hypothetical protein
VDTGLADTELTGILVAASPPEYMTPHSTIVKAFEAILNDDGKTGLAAECSGDNVYFQDHQRWSADKCEFIMDYGLDPHLEKLGYKVNR